MSVDPYAPPKTVVPDTTNNTTYLDQDGYAFNNELVANKHFKSPLICAKLGIPIPPENLPEAKLITITKVPRIPTFIIRLTSLISIFLLFLSFSQIGQNYFIPAIIIYILAAKIIKSVTYKPYQIPFYFSEQYTHMRKKRILIYSLIFLSILITISYSIFTRNLEVTFFSIVAAIITYIFFKFKTTYFVVTDNKGEFYYIRGVHSGLLQALPSLPITQ